MNEYTDDDYHEAIYALSDLYRDAKAIAGMRDLIGNSNAYHLRKTVDAAGAVLGECPIDWDGKSACNLINEMARFHG